MTKITSRRRRANGKRAVIYVRQSTFREESISLDNQKKLCREYIQRLGYTVVKGPDGEDAVFEDPGFTGLNMRKRKGLKAALDLIRDSRADVIVVWRLNRLSRRVLHRQLLHQEIRKHGGRVEAINQEVDDTTPVGKLTLHMQAGIDEFESAVKSEVWMEVHRYRVENGLPPGGAPPFGYRYGGKGKPYEPDTQTAPIVAEMYRRYLDGYGVAKITGWLNAEGYRTTKDKPFSVGAVTRLLDNPFNAGKLRIHPQDCDCVPPMEQDDDEDGRRCDRRVEVDGAHDAILDAATWERYTRERERRRYRESATGSQSHPKRRTQRDRWWLGGLVKCGRCGSGMILSGKNGPDKLLVCGKYKNQRKAACAGAWVNKGALERAVNEWIDWHLHHLAEHADALLADDAQHVRLTQERADLTAEHQEVTDGRKELAALVLQRVLSAADVREAVDESEKRLRQIEDRLREVDTELESLDHTDVLSDVEKVVKAGEGFTTQEEWDAFNRKVIKRVDVTADVVTITGWRGQPQAVSRHAWPFRSTRANHAEQPRNAGGRFVKKAPAEPAPMTQQEFYDDLYEGGFLGPQDFPKTLARLRAEEDEYEARQRAEDDR